MTARFTRRGFVARRGYALYVTARFTRRGFVARRGYALYVTARFTRRGFVARRGYASSFHSMRLDLVVRVALAFPPYLAEKPVATKEVELPSEDIAPLAPRSHTR